MLNISKFYRQILINLFLVTVCTLSIFFAIYLGNQYISSTASLEQSHTNRANEITLAIDDKLASGINILNQISINELTSEYLSLQSPNPIVTLDLYKYMSNTTSIISNLELTIGIYNPNLDMVLSNQGTCSLSDFLNKFEIANDPRLKPLIDFNASTHENLIPGEVFLTQSSSKDYLCYVVRKDKIPYEPLFFIAYSTDSLIKNFTQDDTFKNISLQEINTLSDSSRNIKSSYSIRSNVLPINYILTFTSNTAQLFGKTLINALVPFIIILLISLVLIYKFSNKLYSPVKKLISSTTTSDDETQIIDEFEYIQQRVDTLKDTIHNYNLSNKDMLLKELLYGIKKENIQDLLLANHIHLFNKATYMVIITTKHLGTLQVDTSTAKTYIELSLSSVFNELTEYQGYKLINISPSTSVLFINNLSRQQAKRFLEDLTPTLHEYRFIITTPASLADISSRFYNINELIKNDKIGNTHSVILEEEIIIQARIPYVYSESDKKHLLYNMTSGNKEELLTLLNTILTENLFKRELAPQVQNEFLSALCSTAGLASKDLKDTNELFVLLTSIKDKNELSNAITNLFLEYYHYINSDESKKDLKYNFLDYIHANYDQDISLADMANEFNLAVNYVGVLFKEKTGYNFKDYLNTYRINVAKQILLETPNIKIKDLSTSVGFINTNTFIRIFKKYEAMSPGQYQKYVMDTASELQ